MIPYASHTDGKNLEALRALGWRVLISAAASQHWSPRGFRYCLDPGAWHYHHHGKPFDEIAYERMIDKLAPGADFVLLPDIVEGGMASLELSTRWSNRVFGAGAPIVLIAVQDGMTPADLAPLVGTRVGIFLGGSTHWKLTTAVMWGTWCASLPFTHPLSTPARPLTGCWFHFARVNTLKRFALAHDAGADSIDGSSASKWKSTLPLLEAGRRQLSLLDPRRLADRGENL